MTQEELQEAKEKLETRKVIPYPKRVLFIKGPVPKKWVQEACRLARRSPQVAWALVYLAGLTKSTTVKLTRKVRRDFYLGRHSTWRGLKLLEEAGLIRVLRGQGKSPMVTLLWDWKSEELEGNGETEGRQ